MVVPLSAFSPSPISNEGVPSQLHFTAVAPSFQLRVSMVTLLATINAE